MFGKDLREMKNKKNQYRSLAICKINHHKGPG
jgi:hypothetical protein